MEGFIDRELEQLNLASQQDRDALRDTLRNGANGMFIWVDIMIKYLRRRTRFFSEQLLESLRDLPTDLGSLYSRILQRLADDKDFRRTSKHLLTWVACARRPLTLEELATSLTVRIGQTEKPIITLSGASDLRQAVNDFCGPLVKIQENSFGRQTVSLVHASVKDFLFDQKNANEPYGNMLITEAEAHLSIGEVCLTYLCYDDVGSVPVESPNPARIDMSVIVKHFELHPLLRYASTNWWEHLSAVDANLLNQTPLKRLYTSPNRTLKWMQLCFCAHIWQIKSRARNSGKFSRKLRLELAIRLSKTVMEYLSSPWLSEEWHHQYSTKTKIPHSADIRNFTILCLGIALLENSLWALIPNNTGVLKSIETAYSIKPEDLGDEFQVYYDTIDWCLQRTYRV
ncbi:hypothetical protein DL95DRAFT_381025, partial [Leptodontidium sp. 2 PMI_412]